MKTIEKKYYVCEICGKTSQEKAKIEKCQDRHLKINDDCVITTTYDNGKEYPKSLNITFADGSIVRYFLIGKIR